jgi:hypothetical protein
MHAAHQMTLAKRALADIDQILNNFDHGGTIETTLPLLQRVRRMLEKWRATPDDRTPKHNDATWAADLVTVFTKFSGQCPHPRLYREVKELRIGTGRSWPKKARSVIRQTLQAHNRESKQYQGGDDLFRMVCPGLWRLRDSKVH